MLTGLLLTLMAAAPEVMFGDAGNYFVAGDFADIVEVDGTIYAASGFGLTTVPADLSSQEHFPTPYYSRKIASADKRLYLGEGTRITAFKVSGKAVQMLASYPVQGRITALAAGKDFVAAGTDSAKVEIFSQDSRLKPIAVIDMPETVKDIVFYKGFLYAACGREGVVIIRLGDAPAKVGELSLSGARALEVGENTLFVAIASTEIYGFSLADPASPQEKIKFSSSSPAVSLAYYDKHLYAAQRYQGYSIFNLRGERVELAEPFRQGDVVDILPTDEGVFLALREAGVVRLEDETLAELTLTARLEQNSPSIHTTQSGSFWAVARGEDGASIVRLFEGETFVTLGHAEPPPSNAAGVFLSGTYLYVADVKHGASIYNMKTFPVAERSFDLHQPGEPQRINLTNDLIPLAAGEWGLRVLWICPCGPLKQRSALGGFTAVDVAARDSIIYVADPDSGLRIMEVSEEGVKLTQLSVYPGVISPRALLRDGDVLYVADSIGAIAALDVSDPANPEQLSFTFIDTRPYGLDIENSTLYVACGESGVLEIDVSDPSAPKPGEFIETPGKALAVAASKRHLGVADYTSWILLPLE